MTLFPPVLLAVISLPFQAPPSAHKDPPVITAMITSEPAGADWVSPGSNDRADSASDLARSLMRRSSILRLVKDGEQADIIIEVTGRDVTDAGKTVLVFSGSTAVVKRLEGRSVAARVHVGARTFNFAGTTGTRYWSAAASDLAKDIDAWANANMQQILATRARDSR